MLIAVDTICSLWGGLCDDCVILPAKLSVLLRADASGGSRYDR